MPMSHAQRLLIEEKERLQTRVDDLRAAKRFLRRYAGMGNDLASVVRGVLQIAGMSDTQARLYGEAALTQFDTADSSGTGDRDRLQEVSTALGALGP